MKHAAPCAGRVRRGRRCREAARRTTKTKPWRRGPVSERIAELGAAEEILLTVSTEGYGKRTSAYEFRRTGRGGQGLLAQDLTKRGGRLAASFPVDETDQILLVTDQGQLIRTPVRQVRMVGRNTSGVIIFRTSEDEHVVSVERLADTGEDEFGRR